jgi:hypothetical protein
LETATARGVDAFGRFVCVAFDGDAGWQKVRCVGALDANDNLPPSSPDGGVCSSKARVEEAETGLLSLTG